MPAGVAGVEAEAELLAAMVMFFERVGLTAHDVVIKMSSRQVLQAVLEQHQVPEEATSRVFVTVDKMDKLPRETVRLLLFIVFQTAAIQPVDLSSDAADTLCCAGTWVLRIVTVSTRNDCHFSPDNCTAHTGPLDPVPNHTEA